VVLWHCGWQVTECPLCWRRLSCLLHCYVDKEVCIKLNSLWVVCATIICQVRHAVCGGMMAGSDRVVKYAGADTTVCCSVDNAVYSDQVACYPALCM
jgi:hypothetical protein